jgi:hypothetical protein
MRSYLYIAVPALMLAVLTSTRTATAQRSAYEQFRSKNAEMAEVQPTWMGPLMQSDARLAQAMKFSVSNATAPGARIVSYGNNKGFSLLAGRRFQFDFNPPSYFRNHSATLSDGFGNASTQIKYRIASGNAEHGNFAVTAILSRAFGGGFEQNGMLTDFYCPKIAAGKALGRFNVQSALNGELPAGKVDLQGRAIEWNTTVQMHTSAHTYFDVENNAAWFKGGLIDGKMQNFLAPAGYYVVRRKGWEPTHVVVVFDAGMQIATSSFHCYNHNLITEMRLLF